MKLSRFFFVLSMIVMGTQFLFVKPAYAAGCIAPDANKQNEVAVYIQKRYHFSPSDQLVLLEAGRVGSSCFWRFHYQTAQKRDLVLFLSPDGEHLTPTLFDIAIDPAVEEQARAASTEKKLLSGSPATLGRNDAKVTIVEFSDFECPYCKRMKDMLNSEIMRPGSPSIRIVYRYFPLQMHPWARSAALFASCVQSVDPAEFWKLHDFMFDHQKELTNNNLTEKLMSVVELNTKIDQNALRTCIAGGGATEAIDSDQRLGEALGVSGTPTLFVNGNRIPGIRDAAQLRSMIVSAANNQYPQTAALQPAIPVMKSDHAAVIAPQCQPTGR